MGMAKDPERAPDLPSVAGRPVTKMVTTLPSNSAVTTLVTADRYPRALPARFGLRRRREAPERALA